MGDLNLNSVNWQDGMLITQQHLKDQEKYFEELARWYTLQAGDGYGLVRKSTDGREALAMDISVTGDHLRVEITRCQAITQDGKVIEINDINRNQAWAETTLSGSSIAVYIGIDLQSKIQVGDPDPSEDIPRVPYLAYAYSLHLGQPPNLPVGNYLQVAELMVTGNDVSQNMNFYPPCVTLYAHEGLNNRAGEFRNRLENLLSLCSRAHMAVSSGGLLAGEKTELQVAFKETVFQFGFYLSSSLDEFEMGRNASHPLVMVNFFKKLFRVFTTLMNFHPGLKDLLNEKFFTHDLKSDIGTFISSVDNFLLSKYNHQGLGEHLRTIDEILTVVHGVLGFLAQVKKDQLGEQAVATDTVTYMGKTYRGVEYSECRTEQASGLIYLLIDIPKPGPVTDMVTLLSKDLFSINEWNSMQVRLGINEARGLGETDPVTIDTVAFSNKVALRAQDMVKASAVNRVNLIFRGVPDVSKFDNLGKSDLIVYAV
ncbi:MAG: hypothetical protein DRP47_09915 [Candidatus Zixiibacteriota bacterium]|nr:MAG: hypothetical protein DRP47_09915 [candidate division Zixibacteria bacterium]